MNMTEGVLRALGFNQGVGFRGTGFRGAGFGSLGVRAEGSRDWGVIWAYIMQLTVRVIDFTSKGPKAPSRCEK